MLAQIYIQHILLTAPKQQIPQRLPQASASKNPSLHPSLSRHLTVPSSAGNPFRAPSPILRGAPAVRRRP